MWVSKWVILIWSEPSLYNASCNQPWGGRRCPVPAWPFHWREWTDRMRCKPLCAQTTWNTWGRRNIKNPFEIEFALLQLWLQQCNLPQSWHTRLNIKRWCVTHLRQHAVSLMFSVGACERERICRDHQHPVDANETNANQHKNKMLVSIAWQLLNCKWLWRLLPQTASLSTCVFVIMIKILNVDTTKCGGEKIWVYELKAFFTLIISC